MGLKPGVSVVGMRMAMFYFLDRVVGHMVYAFQKFIELKICVNYISIKFFLNLL